MSGIKSPLGYTNNPPRGFFRSITTCVTNKDHAFAFGLIEAPGTGNGGTIDPKISTVVDSSGITGVERIGVGQFRVSFSPGRFQKPPTVIVTPCESFTLGGLSVLFPTEQTIIICSEPDTDEVIVTTGRTPVFTSLTIPVLGPPEVRDNIDFHILALGNQ